MNLVKKMLFLVLTLSVGIISCEQENGIEVNNQVYHLANEALSSLKFQNLNVSVSSLDVSASQFVNVEKKSILIPFKGYDDRKGVIALFNNNYVLMTVAAYEVITNVSADLVYSELNNASFSGTFVFRAENGEVVINMNNSRITSSKISKRSTGGRTEECNDMTESGGALDCAGARLENMNWFDKSLCYASFIPCMAQLVISCAVDGCVVEPQEPNG